MQDSGAQGPPCREVDKRLQEGVPSDGSILTLLWIQLFPCPGNFIYLFFYLKLLYVFSQKFDAARPKNKEVVLSLPPSLSLLVGCKDVVLLHGLVNPPPPALFPVCYLILNPHAPIEYPCPIPDDRVARCSL